MNFSSEAIETISALHRRYAVYSARPARAIRFLRNLSAAPQFSDSKEIGKSDVIKAFSDETGLPDFLLDDEIPLNAAQTEKFFSERVIGQNDAVNLIVDLIATVKARLTRPRKPIASLLFIGSTGVGKTETVKSLAEFFFGDKNRLIRFDMSEFANPFAVRRLIGGSADGEGLLTAKVREQPFSVLLLDEFEKADFSFFDLLLQVLGEGRLTDALGRTADFTNTIIVMTSNLGASDFRRGKSGFAENSRSRQSAVKHFTDAVRGFLRPEIFNRIDRIVPFAPLDEKAIRAITRLEIDKALMRDGLRFRPVTLEISDDVTEMLARKGFDELYGARPLKREIEHSLLIPLSAELNKRAFQKAWRIAATLDDKRGICLKFVSDAEMSAQIFRSSMLSVLSGKIAETRRIARNLESHQRATSIIGDIHRIEELEKMKRKGKYVTEAEDEEIKRLPGLHNFQNRLRRFSEEISKLEDDALFALYGRVSADEKDFQEKQEKYSVEADELLIDSWRLLEPQADVLRFAVFSRNANALFRLMRAYLYCFEEFSCYLNKLAVYTTLASDKQTEAEISTIFERSARLADVKEPEEFLAENNQTAVGFLCEIKGRAASLRFSAEQGLHRFLTGTRTDDVFFTASRSVKTNFEIPAEFAERRTSENFPLRRVYSSADLEIRDIQLNEKTAFNGRVIAPPLAAFIDKLFTRTARNLD